MAKDPFLLVSLEESESKSLAQVISNDSARKVLDYLSRNEKGTESEISIKLKVPLSTVHYNLQALVKANLVKASEFHYSAKGKEVLHYSLANKIIIIAPKNEASRPFLQKLKSLLPIGLITLGAAAVIHIARPYLEAADFAKSALLDEAGAGAASKIALDAGPEALSIAMQAAPEAVKMPAGIFSGDYTALWFLAGSVFALLAVLVWGHNPFRNR